MGIYVAASGSQHRICLSSAGTKGNWTEAGCDDESKRMEADGTPCFYLHFLQHVFHSRHGDPEIYSNICLHSIYSAMAGNDMGHPLSCGRLEADEHRDSPTHGQHYLDSVVYFGVEVTHG